MKESKLEKAKRLVLEACVKGESGPSEIRRDWIVRGDTGERHVNMRVLCDCPYGLKGRICSHILAAMIELVGQAEVKRS